MPVPSVTKVILIGQMGAGKSTVARHLAARWRGFAACDLDHEIEARGRTIASIFEDEGETGFRALEAEVLDRVLARDESIVLATGGGTPCQPGAMPKMRAAGLVIWLDAPPSLLAARITTSSSGSVRPLISGLDLGDAERFLARQLESRRGFYAQADLTIDASDGAEHVAHAIDRSVSRLVDLGLVKLDVQLPLEDADSYTIDIVPDLPGPATAAALRNATRAKRVLIVSDDNVAPLYAAGLEAALADAGFTSATTVFPAGEAAKSLATIEALLDAAFAAKLARGDAFIALGGGVVGDLTGFAAAIFQRGVDVVQVPTTLLAQVDSSVGGKTGVNHPRGKNLIGAFWQPRAVIASQAVLRSLPPREVRCGLAEAVKHAFIADASLLDWIRHEAPAILALAPAATARLVEACCRIKAAVVAEDPREDPDLSSGGRRARMILNFGHTFGHAYEKLLGYGTWTHGEAVALGMVWAARLSDRIAGASLEATVVATLAALGLPHDPAAPGLPALGELIEAAKGDKKGDASEVRFVLLEALARPRIERLSWTDITRTLERG